MNTGSTRGRTTIDGGRARRSHTTNGLALSVGRPRGYLARSICLSLRYVTLLLSPLGPSSSHRSSSNLTANLAPFGESATREINTGISARGNETTRTRTRSKVIPRVVRKPLSRTARPRRCRAASTYCRTRAGEKELNRGVVVPRFLPHVASCVTLCRRVASRCVASTGEKSRARGKYIPLSAERRRPRLRRRRQ